MTDELWALSATELRGHYLAGDLSPVEVTEAILERMERSTRFCTRSSPPPPRSRASRRGRRKAGTERRHRTATAGSSGVDQGPGVDEGSPHDVRLASEGGLRARGRRPRGGATARRRHGDARKDQCPRGRLEGRDHQPADRLDLQPLAARPRGRRIQRRRGGSGCVRDRPDRTGLGRRGVDPRARRLLWHLRTQADVRHRPAVAAQQHRHALPHRPDDPHGRGCGGDAGGDGGAGSARSARRRPDPGPHSDGLADGIDGIRIAYSPDLGYVDVDPEVAAICATPPQSWAGRARGSTSRVSRSPIRGRSSTP